jgi:hypothetical protein
VGERGGIVPGLEGNAVPIIAHAQEMVLPTEIANPLKSAISSGQFAGGEDVGEPHGDFPEVPSYRGGNETISPDIVASAVPGAPGGIGGAGGSGSAVVSPEILASAIAAAGAPGAGGGAAGFGGAGGPAGAPAGAPAEISPEISPEIIASAISGAGLPGAGGGAGAPGGAGGIGGASGPGGIGGVGGFASAFSEGGPGGTPRFEIPSLQDLAIAVPRATDRLTDAISSGDDLASTVGNRITHNTYNNNHLHMAPTFNGIGSHEEMMDVVKKAVIPLVQKGLRRGNIG